MTDLPKPEWATFPDGGHYVDRFNLPDDLHHVTAHDGGTLRVWRGEVNHMMGTRPYYPIEAVGMNEDDLCRAIGVAITLLEMPHNRRQRRVLNG